MTKGGACNAAEDSNGVIPQQVDGHPIDFAVRRTDYLPIDHFVARALRPDATDQRAVANRAAERRLFRSPAAILACKGALFLNRHSLRHVSRAWRNGSPWARLTLITGMTARPQAPVAERPSCSRLSRHEERTHVLPTRTTVSVGLYRKAYC